MVPVMVWIHGGSFQFGANFIYPGYFLAEHDVVVVAVNYRLGIMGACVQTHTESTSLPKSP